MITISITTIIAGAVVVLLAILGSLVNPFLRSLRFPETEGNETEGNEESGNKAEFSQKENAEPVTILITAHDNLPELERNLPMFLNQQYAADYQVIVVSQSTDVDTIDFLKRTAAQNPHLYYTYIPESSRYMSRKKLQITLGVKAAKYEWIILTEPTCRPESNQWLAAMAQQFSTSTHLVLGYVAFDDETKRIRRFESIHRAFYLLRRAQHSYAYRTHMPNVAFRKSDFMEGQGYQGNLEYIRGEYDFLVNKYAECGDTAVELGRQAWLVHDEPSNKSWHKYPPLSTGFTQVAQQSQVYAHPSLLRPSAASSESSRIYSSFGMEHLCSRLDTYRLRWILTYPPLRHPHAHRPQGHQAF